MVKWVTGVLAAVAGAAGRGCRRFARAVVEFGAVDALGILVIVCQLALIVVLLVCL